jgi:hypothetical protein
MLEYKSCILLIFSVLMVTKLLIYSSIIHNLYAIFAKLLDICKMFSADLVNEKGNIPRREQNYLRIKEDKKVQLAT